MLLPPPPSVLGRVCEIRNSESPTFALLGKQIDTYRKLKPVYDRYKASKDKEKFLRGLRARSSYSRRQLGTSRGPDSAGLTKLPSTEKIKVELNGLSTRKAALQAELRKIQREEKEYGMIHQNIDTLLSVPIKPIRQNKHELE